MSYSPMRNVVHAHAHDYVECMQTPTLSPPVPPPPASLRFRDAQFRRYATARGLATDAEIAAATGLDRSTVGRLLRADVAPGQKIIAAILAVFPDRRFEDFFEVTAGGPAAGARAA
jgi:hypothetical protein